MILGVRQKLLNALSVTIAYIFQRISAKAQVLTWASKGTIQVHRINVVLLCPVNRPCFQSGFNFGSKPLTTGTTGFGAGLGQQQQQQQAPQGNWKKKMLNKNDGKTARENVKVITFPSMSETILRKILSTVFVNVGVFMRTELESSHICWRNEMFRW